MKVSRRTILQTSAAALAMPHVRRARAEDKVVNVYNWVDYIGETTIEDFQTATGIEVVYDTYDSSETAEAKIMAGSSGYDVVDTSSTTLPRFIPSGVFLKLDKAKLPNWKHLDPAILKVISDRDPDNAYCVPYMWGTVGIAVNLDMVKERIPDAPLDSMELLLNPEYMAKLADCGVNILESPTDVVPMVLKHLGFDPNSEKPEETEAVVKAFEAVRPHIRTFDSANYINALPNKELCVSMSWAGEYATAKARAAEAGIELNLAYSVPKTGSGAWFDVMVIPADAEHKESAHAFLNYLMDPEVIAKCTNFTNYANANLTARKFVDKAVLEDPAVYPSDDIMKTLWLQDTASQEYE
ncbi:MAG: polyamine ABC transporter substrate-binding protein, partial [Pseudomonadota bacterium]|nr:polyamine ABC transporter substrate-binding protein [Pseudomonadota bacterium]